MTAKETIVDDHNVFLPFPGSQLSRLHLALIPPRVRTICYRRAYRGG